MTDQTAPSGHAMFYFGLVCPSEVEDRVRLLKQWVRDRYGSKTAMKSPAHITLVPPFWWPTDRVETLQEMAGQFRFAISGLDLRLNGYGHFRKRVIYISVEENGALSSLRSDFNTYMKPLLGAMLKDDAHEFTPHVTIATRDLSPAAFDGTWAYLQHRPFEARMTLRAISLLVLKEGRWEIFKQYPWAPADGDSRAFDPK